MGTVHTRLKEETILLALLTLSLVENIKHIVLQFLQMVHKNNLALVIPKQSLNIGKISSSNRILFALQR